MTAFGEEISHVPRLGFVQNIVQHHQSRAVISLLEISEAVEIDDPASGTSQLLARNGSFFADVPNDNAKIRRSTYSVYVR